MLLVRELLQRCPHLNLTVASDGRSGLAAALTCKPDLVLLDMNLPDMTGVDVLRLLRKNPALSNVRVVALSANAMSEDLRNAYGAGALEYWTKPIDFATFLAGMRRLLDPSHTNESDEPVVPV